MTSSPTARQHGDYSVDLIRSGRGLPKPDGNGAPPSVKQSLLFMKGDIKVSFMNLLQLTSADLKEIAGLLKEKEALVARIAKIDSRLMAYTGGAPAPAPAKAKMTGKAVTKPTVRVRRPGKLKAKVIALIQGAGKNGISVREIAAKLGLNPQRIYVWFNSTGKSIKEIKKVAPATYTWNG